MQHFFRSVGRIAAADAALLRRFPRYLLAVIAIAVVPSLYALIYLTSVWDPNANTHALPVAIVNLDAGLQYQGHAVNVGAELTKSLVAMGTFGFKPMSDADAARRAVRSGALAFAIVIPSDFSANAVPGVQPGAGKVLVILSEGNNYVSAGYARRFAEDLGHRVNETLNEQRWEQVLINADGSGKNLDTLRDGMAQLKAELLALESGLARNNALASQWATGVRQVGSDLRALDDKWPLEPESRALKNGLQRMVARQRELSSAIELAQGEVDRLAQGFASLQEPATSAAVAGNQGASAVELAAARAQVRDRLSAAIESSNRLAAGLARADAAVTRLADKAGSASEGVRGASARLPQSVALDSLVASGKSALDATTRLRFGLEMAGSILPASPGKPDGSARGLADSVEPTLDILAPVANNGSAFAPNMVAMALWLGAVMIVYGFAMQTLPTELADSSRLARTFGKFVIPGATAMVQSVLILLVPVWGLGIPTPNPATFMLTLLVSALAFLAMVVLLLRAFGEAGKLIAVLLLTVQLAAGGGVLPIELSGGLFRAIHEWLAFTWVVRALRASLFGAFDGGWFQAWAVVATVGCLAFLASAFLGRWKLVPAADLRPPIDV